MTECPCSCCAELIARLCSGRDPDGACSCPDYPPDERCDCATCG